ncbi:acyltransferase family protein [Pseudoduganella namucuonensis]|uniref:Peptidoglycan/LPS O-acetylase OafA/YrhL, contains acyltransferase and SGNH-hydrolase domains n=1 Tax=Pseudoduganella namucuonensis TaxID=1035707 RepID=A0A1I7GET1_9BURK|nr:acyltransferase family protein [Pseudoduganella namucuonensis]SFU46831.1 Peptidoglycan/LPS O-acetylase OafA/YrhL, contains acyltransferase and SGNH-hydrolase domains [Pseudoduganella namucuonensis]
MSTEMNRAEFRQDINGLRAWAVTAVMLYHFGVPGAAGGFVGVDVFFVISGFLMTGIVVAALEGDRFSAPAFYWARAKRILPALMALCATLLCLGWLLLLPLDYKTLSAHALYSLAFLSNVAYLREAGYFDLASHDKWLLHTWSLSVEWQFYLALPLLLWAVWRLRPGRAALGRVLALALAVSLAVSVFATAANPSAAFFLLSTRAWEMLAGGLVFLWGGRVAGLGAGRRRALAWTGLGLIVLSVCWLDHSVPWPGALALLPVGAAAMVLLANSDLPATAHPLAQWLGSRSYSLYLWHWPVYVGLAYGGLEDDGAALAAGLALTLLLGDRSYHWLENPARKALGRSGAPRGVALVVAGVALVTVPGGALWLLDGVPQRFAEPVRKAANEANNFNPRRKECHQSKGATSPSCVHGGPERRVVLLGDSHAAALVSGLAGARPDPRAGVLQWTYDACVYLPGMRKLNPHQFNKQADCAGFNQWVTAQLRTVPPQVPVVLIGRYARYAFGALEERRAPRPEVYFGTGTGPGPAARRGQPAGAAFLREFGAQVTRAACELAATRPVYMVRPIPEMPVNVPQYVSRRMAWGLASELSVPIEQYRERNGWLWAAQDAARAQCGVRILDPLPYLCRDGRCFASRDRRPLYYDHGHLSEYGNAVLRPMFAEIYRQRAQP